MAEEEGILAKRVGGVPMWFVGLVLLAIAFWIWKEHRGNGLPDPTDDGTGGTAAPIDVVLPRPDASSNYYPSQPQYVTTNVYDNTTTNSPTVTPPVQPVEPAPNPAPHPPTPAPAPTPTPAPTPADKKFASLPGSVTVLPLWKVDDWIADLGKQGYINVKYNDLLAANPGMASNVGVGTGGAKIFRSNAAYKIPVQDIPMKAG